MSFFEQAYTTLAYIFTAYYWLSNIIYFSLLVASFIAIRRLVFAKPMVESIWKRSAELGPAVSLIAPAFNESRSIVESVHSFLTLDYPKHEVIVVNDGSTDDTLKKLIDEFKLEKTRIFYDDRLSKTPIKGIYRSQIKQNLIVIDKLNGGKADSINVGIGFSSYDIFCAVDSDCILDRDALLKVILPFIEDPDNTVAAGGTVRPVNASEIRKGRVVRTHLPRNPIVLVQIVEYLRAFLFGRVGWNMYDSTMIISGAFGIFKREAVIQVGGYQEKSIGEDMELVLRLRKYAAEHEQLISVAFIPDPICWTEVPSDLLTLGRQRDRWQRGLADSLYRHRAMMMNRRYGMAGLLGYPSFLMFELFQPFIELAAYILIISGTLLGFISTDILILFLVVDLLYGLLMSVGAVLIEESAFHKYPKLHQLIILLFISVFEQIGLRQYVMFWRIMGTAKFLMGDTKWGAMARSGFQAEQPPPKSFMNPAN